ncbi:MAG: Gfo/Idh/MocA family oxidoreductase [Verrucomicrobiales bacterium]|nr:Gfo/Idh/MocA family oxidoreductase [Verrucomicrobiales bacterium]
MINRRTLLSAAAVLPTVGWTSSGKPRLKYLQIGTGHAHANKIAVYEKSDDWEVVGIVEEDPERLVAAKENPTYRDFPFLTLEEGLNTEGLSVVGVETEIRDLLKYAGMALDAGFHLHLDKPAGASFSTYERILKKADAAGLVCQMGYMYRFNPAVQLLHRMLEEGWLGEVFETHAVMSKVMPLPSRQVVDEFAGGTMFELGCHIIDLTVGVLGSPDKVTGHSRRVLENSEDTLVDNMLAVFDYPKATATVRSTALEVEGFARRQFTVCGTEGTFHIQPLDRPSVQLSLSKERQFSGEERKYQKGRSEIQFEPYQRYVGDAADLAATVRGEKGNSFPARHDLAVQRSVLQASGMPI